MNMRLFSSTRFLFLCKIFAFVVGARAPRMKITDATFPDYSYTKMQYRYFKLCIKYLSVYWVLIDQRVIFFGRIWAARLGTFFHENWWIFCSRRQCYIFGKFSGTQSTTDFELRVWQMFSASTADSIIFSQTSLSVSSLLRSVISLSSLLDVDKSVPRPDKSLSRSTGDLSLFAQLVDKLRALQNHDQMTDVLDLRIFFKADKHLRTWWSSGSLFSTENKRSSIRWPWPLFER